MNVAVYARVSTDIQVEHGHSLGAQVEDCTAKAKEIGGDIIKEYVDDGYSGAYLERPALEALRASVRAKMYEAIVVYDIDRLSRNLSHQLLLADEIEKSGARLVFVKSDYEASAEGRLFFAIKGAFAGYEREKFRERSMRGKLAVLRQGKVVQDSHVYGYDFDREERAYTINPAEAETVRQIFSLYLDGAGGVPYIARWLNDHRDQYPPPHGEKWGRSIVRDILRREMYTGRFYANRIYHFKTGATSERKVERPQEEWIEMSCPAIISQEEHQEVMATMTRNRTIDHRPHRHPHLLQGIAICGQCGHHLSVRHGRKGMYYYMCWRNENTSPSYKGCGARSMLCDVTDRAVWSLLTSLCLDEKRLEKYIRASSPTMSTEEQDKKRKEKLEKIRQERKSVMAWHSQQLLSYEEATERLESLKRDEERLMHMNIPIPASEPQTSIREIVESIRDCPPDEWIRQRVVRQCVDHVVLTRLDQRKGFRHYQLDVKIYFRA